MALVVVAEVSLFGYGALSFPPTLHGAGILSAGCRAHGKIGEARWGGLRTVRLAEPCDRDPTIPSGALRFEGRTPFHLLKRAHVVAAQSPPLRRASPEVAVGFEPAEREEGPFGRACFRHHLRC